MTPSATRHLGSPVPPPPFLSHSSLGPPKTNVQTLLPLLPTPFPFLLREWELGNGKVSRSSEPPYYWYKNPVPQMRLSTLPSPCGPGENAPGPQSSLPQPPTQPRRTDASNPTPTPRPINPRPHDLPSLHTFGRKPSPGRSSSPQVGRLLTNSSSYLRVSISRTSL